MITHTQAFSRKLLQEVSLQAHRAAYAAGSTFLEKHDFNQGRYGSGLFIDHGYLNEEEDFIPIMKVVAGDRLRNRHILRQVSALSISRMMRQSFVGNQAWLTGDLIVSVKRFMEPIIKFLNTYHECLDVFAGIYENKFTHTNVFGIYITIKDECAPDKRVCWEITIDDNDLSEVNGAKMLFAA